MKSLLLFTLLAGLAHGQTTTTSTPLSASNAPCINMDGTIIYSTNAVPRSGGIPNCVWLPLVPLIPVAAPKANPYNYISGAPGPVKITGGESLVWDDPEGSLPLTCKRDGTGTGWICKVVKAKPAASKAKVDAIPAQPAFRTMVAPAVTPSSTHQVTLSGCTSTGGTVTGFIFLRATVSGGPYTQLTPGTAATCNYVDTQSLVEGTTYFYVAEATGPGGTSGNSNQVSASIPFLPPGVPTGLQAAPQ